MNGGVREGAREGQSQEENQGEAPTGQVSVPPAGLSALLDPPLSRPGAQWFTGAAHGMDLPAQLFLEHTHTHRATKE